MSIFAMIVVILVAVMHVGFLWVEMFAWTTRGPKLFKIFPQEMFEPTKVMAANQGLYNGFLAAGLIWSLFISNVEWQQNIAVCFLIFVSIAGIYGAMSISKKIFFVQAVPALIGILLVLI